MKRLRRVKWWLRGRIGRKARVLARELQEEKDARLRNEFHASCMDEIHNDQLRELDARGYKPVCHGQGRPCHLCTISRLIDSLPSRVTREVSGL